MPRSSRLEPGKWYHTRGMILWHPRAKAGSEGGKQAYTDLVEAAIIVPKQMFQALRDTGSFTEYDSGLARRGRSKRGTNIFIMTSGRIKYDPQLKRTRPPGKWFERMVQRVSPYADDPKALASWIWHHWLSPSKKKQIEARGERYAD